jgi:hypothetical protein
MAASFSSTAHSSTAHPSGSERGRRRPRSKRQHLALRDNVQVWAIVAVCVAITTGSSVHARSATRPQGLSEGSSSEARTNPGLAPPLLRLTKGRFSAYLLPESHIGSPLEFGPYFHSVVLPAARRSRTMIYEGMNGDTFPGSPFWGQTCLDRVPEAAALRAEFASRIAANHRHSQWADLRRAFSENSEAFANEQFTAFIQARGLMINFWELHSRIRALVERDAALRLSDQPKLTAREYFTEFGAHERIARAVPRLRLESIETVADHAWAICKLTPAQMREALTRAIELFDSTASNKRELLPGVRLQKAAQSFAALHAQLDGTNVAGHRPAGQSSRSVNGFESSLGDPRQHASGSGQVLDLLRLGLRNERWAQRIDEHAAANRHGLIYVLGSDHMVDFDHSASLLTLLRARGFRVEWVR